MSDDVGAVENERTSLQLEAWPPECLQDTAKFWSQVSTVTNAAGEPRYGWCLLCSVYLFQTQPLTDYSL